jgi:hypothetical protein
MTDRHIGGSPGFRPAGMNIFMRASEAGELHRAPWLA